MTDRELLELAAKAARIEGEYIEIHNGKWNLTGFRPTDETHTALWNPLDNDGEALRLAVKLEMQVCIGLRRIDVAIVSDSEEPNLCIFEKKEVDILAATRRAIVRAAAEIGKQASGKNPV